MEMKSPPKLGGDAERSEAGRFPFWNHPVFARCAHEATPPNLGGELPALNIMAKKTKTTTDTSTLTAKDKKTLGSIRGLADDVVQFAERGRAPYVDVPSRSLSNVKFNQSRRIIEMGRGTNRRELFNLAQARSYMQTLLVGTGCKQLIEQGKTTSIRGLFYLLNTRSKAPARKRLIRRTNAIPSSKTWKSRSMR